MDYQITSTPVFEKWIKNLKDPQTRNRVLLRITRMETGQFGDCKNLGEGLHELRFFFGGGIRVYYTFRGEEIILLVTGGDKSSQSRDIEKARQILAELD